MRFTLYGVILSGQHCMTTLLGVQSWVRFCRQEFGEFPRLVGRYYSYLLPEQARGTPQILVDKTSPMIGRLRVWNFHQTFLRIVKGNFKT